MSVISGVISESVVVLVKSRHVGVYKMSSKSFQIFSYQTIDKSKSPASCNSIKVINELSG